MQISVTVTNLDRVNERLSKLGASLHDFSGALAILGRQLITFYSNDVINSQGTPLGSRWAPLAQSTLDYKNKHWDNKPPMIRTGDLQKSFYAESNKDTLFVSNNVKGDYFKYHQLGTRKMPQRRMIGVSPRVNTIIKRTLQADIKTKIESTNI